jgi:hypothetical protein
MMALIFFKIDRRLDEALINRYYTYLTFEALEKNGELYPFKIGAFPVVIVSYN